MDFKPEQRAGPGDLMEVLQPCFPMTAWEAQRLLLQLVSQGLARATKQVHEAFKDDLPTLQ